MARPCHIASLPSYGNVNSLGRTAYLTQKQELCRQIWRSAWASHVAQMVKNLTAIRRPTFDPWVGKIPMATHSGTLVWRTPWTEEPGRQQSMCPQRVRHNRATNTTGLHRRAEHIIFALQLSCVARYFFPEKQSSLLLKWEMTLKA